MVNRKRITDVVVRIFFVIAFIAVLCVAASLPVLADGTLIISGFAGEDAVSWTAGENVQSIGLSKFSWEENGQTYSRSCLEAAGKYGAANSLRAVVANFDEPLNLAEYLSMSFDIYTPSIKEDSDAIFLARLTLICASGDSTEYLEIIEGGKWNHIVADIGSWDGRSNIVKAEIALAVDTDAQSYVSSRFYIDDISVSEPVDREMTKRFMFDSYTVEGALATLAGDKTKISFVSDTDTDVSIEAQAFTSNITRPSNCLRIRLSNFTDSDTLTLRYSTSDSQVTTEDKSITIQIEPNSDMRDYYAYVGNAALLNRIKLTVAQAKGRIELISINAISAYEPIEYETHGTLTHCRLEPDLQTVTFAGEVNRETALANRDGHIAIFAHTSDELPTAAELAQMPPVVKTQMTTRFEISWHIPQNGTYGAGTRFIAACVNTDGEYSLICAPFYVENLDKFASESFKMNYDSKGFCSEDLSLVGYVDAGLTLLELDMLRLFVSKDEAEPYIYCDEVYYFDGAYLGQLASKIETLNGDGVQVLLRVFGWSSEYGEELSARYAADDYVNYSKAAGYSDGTEYISAVASYIAERWASVGKIIGIVYGEGENVATESKTLNEVVCETSTVLRSLYNILVQANSTVKLYVSVTDLYSTAIQMSDVELGLFEYLPALIAETARYGQFPWELAIEKVYRTGNALGREFADATDCDNIRNLLAQNAVSDKHLLFIDRASSAFTSQAMDCIADLVVGTYEAFFCDDIDGYIVFAGLRADEIADSVRCVYTDQAYVVEKIIKNELGISDFSNLIYGFDEDKLPSKRLSSCEMATEASLEIKGTFSYYRFDAVSSIGALAPSYYSNELRIANDGGSVLSVKLSKDCWNSTSNAAWMGIGHAFDLPEDLRLTPVLALTLKIDDVTSESVYSAALKVVLKSENERFEAMADVPVGEWITLYIDTANFRSAKDTENLHIFVGNGELASATLKIRGIDGLSSQYNDQSLAAAIEQARLKRTNPQSTVDYTEYLPIAAVVLVAVATVVIVAILTKRKKHAQ